MSLFIILLLSSQFIKNKKQKRDHDSTPYTIVIYTWGLNTGVLKFTSINQGKKGIIEYICFVRREKYIAKVDIKTVNSILKAVEKTRALWMNPPRVSIVGKLWLTPKLYPYPDDSGITLIIKRRQRILGGIDDFEWRLIKFRRYKGYKDLEQCIDTLFKIVYQYGKNVGLLSGSEIQQYKQQREKDLEALSRL